MSRLLKMEHSFNIELAKEYGILEAILLKNIWFWIEKNRANEKNFYDGTYWTYNSTRAFNELFPYASESSIKRALKSLQEKGIIKTGNYNKIAYDRTLWYATTEKGKSILHTGEMDFTSRGNGFYPEGKAIPNINTNINTDSYAQTQKELPDSLFASFGFEKENAFWKRQFASKRHSRGSKLVWGNIIPLPHNPLPSTIPWAVRFNGKRPQ